MTTTMTEGDFRISVFMDPREAERLRLTLAARRAYGAWLERVPWDHFVTLTFAFPVAMEGAIRAFKRWIQHVGQRAGRKIGWFYALERGAAGHLHFHALTTGTATLESGELGDAWRSGRTDASPYDPSKGASYYVTKEIGLGVVHYDVSRRWNARTKPVGGLPPVPLRRGNARRARQ